MSKQETKLLNAYLVVGNDELKAETVVKKLWTRLEQLGDIDFNSQVLDGTREIDVQTLLDTLNTPPLASPVRVVLIREIDKAGKPIMDALADYLSSPLSSTILVMTANKLTPQSRLLKAVKALDDKALIDASDRKRSELPAMVRQLAQGYQVSLSYDGAQKMIELIGTSTIALNSEVRKLASYVIALGKSDANLSDVMTVVAPLNQHSPWDFVEAFSRRDLVQSLQAMKDLPRETPVGLLSLCVIRIRELLQYQSLAARGERDLEKILGKRDWQLKKTAGLAANYEIGELRDLLISAACADVRMKSGEDATLVLEEFVLAACR